MLSPESVQAHLAQVPEISFVEVKGDGYHYNLTIVSDSFEGKRKIARQQWVYSHLKEFIATGAMHAVNMETWTVLEWENIGG